MDFLPEILCVSESHHFINIMFTFFHVNTHPSSTIHLFLTTWVIYKAFRLSWTSMVSREESPLGSGGWGWGGWACECWKVSGGRFRTCHHCSGCRCPLLPEPPLPPLSISWGPPHHHTPPLRCPEFFCHTYNLKLFYVHARLLIFLFVCLFIICFFHWKLAGPSIN